MPHLEEVALVDTALTPDDLLPLLEKPSITYLSSTFATKRETDLFEEYLDRYGKMAYREVPSDLRNPSPGAPVGCRDGAASHPRPLRHRRTTRTRACVRASAGWSWHGCRRSSVATSRPRRGCSTWAARRGCTPSGCSTTATPCTSSTCSPGTWPGRERLGGHERFTATVGDARALPLPDASVDAVLLLGPLYHLTDRADRLATWREAVRVVVPGGVVVAMAINRFASLFDGLAQSYLFDPAFRAIVAQDLATGVHENPTGDPRWFTSAYFHRPEELAAEATEAGLVVRETVGVEGLAHWIKPLASAFDDPDRREVVLDAARVIEAEPSLLGLSSHLLTVAARPAG